MPKPSIPNEKPRKKDIPETPEPMPIKHDIPPETHTFSRHLSVLMVERGYHSSGLANQANVSRYSLGRWLRGTALPTSSELGRIIDVLHLRDVEQHTILDLYYANLALQHERLMRSQLVSQDAYALTKVMYRLVTRNYKTIQRIINAFSPEEIRAEDRKQLLRSIVHTLLANRQQIAEAQDPSAIVNQLTFIEIAHSHIFLRSPDKESLLTENADESSEENELFRSIRQHLRQKLQESDIIQRAKVGDAVSGDELGNVEDGRQPFKPPTIEQTIHERLAELKVGEELVVSRRDVSSQPQALRIGEVILDLQPGQQLVVSTRPASPLAPVAPGLPDQRPFTRPDQPAQQLPTPVVPIATTEAVELSSPSQADQLTAQANAVEPALAALAEINHVTPDVISRWISQGKARLRKDEVDPKTERRRAHCHQALQVFRERRRALDFGPPLPAASQAAPQAEASQPEELLRTTEASARYGLSPSQLRTLARKYPGKIAIRDGKDWRFHPQPLDDYLAKRKLGRPPIL